jgi:predicted GNAT family N-acyltransferase
VENDKNLLGLEEENQMIHCTKKEIPSLPTEKLTGPIRIGTAVSAEEKTAIYHFRYQIYVEEMLKQLKQVDHTDKLLYDELDEWGILLFAEIGSELIATARINIGGIGRFPREEANLLALDKFRDSVTAQKGRPIAFVTKVMVAPAYRSSRAFYLLIEKCYELCCANKVDFMFGICNFHLLRMYEKMGTRRYSGNYFLPGYGLQIPLVLLINDIEHLRGVHSPLWRAARKRDGLDGKDVEWFHSHFTNRAAIMNSQLVTEEEVWAAVSERLACLPTKAIAMLEGLTVSEAKKFLHMCASYVHCSTGEVITIQGDVSYTYNILLAGKLRALNLLNPVKEYVIPGQAFAANGLTASNKHTEDIVVVDDAEIAVLSGAAFLKFQHCYPEIGHKIVKNMLQLTQPMSLSIK